MRLLSALLLVSTLACNTSPGQRPISDDQPLSLPQPGGYQLRILSPDVLELTLVTAKRPDPAGMEQWDFVDANGRARLPAPEAFEVLVNGRNRTVQAVGFKRRVLYAPLKERDLRVANHLYVQLETPVADGDSVEVRNRSGKLWPEAVRFAATADPLRWSPAVHVNQTGYLPGRPKLAMVGYYLGSLGELQVGHLAAHPSSTDKPAAPAFKIVDSSGSEVFSGSLKPRRDEGFPFTTYQHVWEAEFTRFDTPGEYRLLVPGLGTSFPFFIGDGVAGVIARTYALGLYHQRCGTANSLPFTRFTHGPCHTAPAEVPAVSARFETVNSVLAQETAEARKVSRHTAPPLSNVAASLYPFVKKGPVDVRGGHHDAGDYSKYTQNSATLIHPLIFAADNFPGVSELDNLGIPESGDGRSDILQEAKWEADFLAKMQDEDGGFYFLVYPRDRRYENDVTPDRGDPQVVFPKTTSVTAAAVAALAQCASSPRFKKQFPEAAAEYLAKARKGWAFLERAIAKHGNDGAYQKITHYGNDFMHDDELAWAACELFLATGEAVFHDRLREWMNPADPATRKWGWVRLYEAYGHAIRSYAFAARSGRVKREQLDARFLAACESEVTGAAEDHLRNAEKSAYGTSFPVETKRTRTAGWYFSGDAAFDLAVASQLDYPHTNDPRPRFLHALLSNLNFEAGCNPVNVTYLTGLGWKRQREVVHQYAQNDHRVLPPSGIPIGNIHGGFGWLDHYGKELGALSFPPDDHDTEPYPFYDRWGDSFNLTQEFVALNQARGLAYAAWLMAQTPLRTQAWTSARATIQGTSPPIKAGQKILCTLAAGDLDLKNARIVWEASGHEPYIGPQFPFNPRRGGPQWIEAEAVLPDGRRVFAVANFSVR